jgi:hypothetical protein
MAQGFAKAAVGVLDGTLNPPAKFDGRIVGAKLRSCEAILDLAQATVAKNNGDTNVLFRFPAGAKPIAFVLNTSADLGAAATIALGNATTAAKYMAAATFRTPNVPAVIMLASAADDDPLAAFEDVLLTIGAANLPGAGVLMIHGIYSAR